MTIPVKECTAAFRLFIYAHLKKADCPLQAVQQKDSF
jgi:hypothetical protein